MHRLGSRHRAFNGSGARQGLEFRLSQLARCKQGFTIADTHRRGFKHSSCAIHEIVLVQTKAVLLMAEGFWCR